MGNPTTTEERIDMIASMRFGMADILWITRELRRSRAALTTIAGWAAAEQDEEIEQEALRGLGE